MQLNENLFSQADQDFEAFLNENHERIIFSGQYGSGKTTFLNYFFDKHSKQYTAFRISPVNYVTSINEDIIDLIKYDLITQFLINGTTVQTNDIPSSWFVSKEDIDIIFQGLLSIVEFKGLKFENVYQKFRELKQSLEKKKNDSDEQEAFAKYLTEIESRKGIYEKSLTSKMIESVILRINNTDSDTEEFKKETVLIIDDFDRIDPDHIFRILNIFSAHFDNQIFSQNTFPNKFGFSKIIIVCDYRIIKSLYSLRYGVESNFEGYIDKFYSKTIFHFDNKNLVQGYIGNWFSMVHKDTLEKYQYFPSLFKSNSNLFLINTITYGVEYKFITVRTLSTLENYWPECYNKSLDRQLKLYRIYLQDELTWFLFHLNLFLYKGEHLLRKATHTILENDKNLNIDKKLLRLISQIEVAWSNINDSPLTKEILIRTQDIIYVITEPSSLDIIIQDKANLTRELTNKDYVEIFDHFLDRLKSFDENL